MRVVNSSIAARYRKDLALTLLPVVVDTARWSSLKHWQGAHLEELVGFAYQPSTLDKHARELKLSGASHAARESVASFWLEREAEPSGMVVVYVDGSTKPIWTRTFSRSTKISSTGRVMPATTTMMLNSGSGTPLVYRSYSGSASLAREVTGLLREVDDATGGGQVRRLVVLDREGHSVALYRELMSKGWQFITPLRSQVTKDTSRFEEVTDWEPYKDTGDEVCEGVLPLRDKRAGEADLRVRVVGRRRGRTGKVFWLATPTGADLLSAPAVMDTYFSRWPNQELVFRDGKGRVGLDVHHGYGKEKVTNYAVVDEMERLGAQASRLRQTREQVNLDNQEELEALGASEYVLEQLEEALTEAKQVAQALDDDAGVAEVRAAYERTDETREALLEHARCHAARERAASAIEVADARFDTREMTIANKIEKLARKREIFTVDVELDDIMTAYKLTFLNLAHHVMGQFLGKKMEIDTLIRSVLTLPGERVRTSSHETIRIYNQPRDPKTMSLVEAACETVNGLGLTRGKRKLRFELTTGP